MPLTQVQQSNVRHWQGGHGSSSYLQAPWLIASAIAVWQQVDLQCYVYHRHLHDCQLCRYLWAYSHVFSDGLQLVSIHAYIHHLCISVHNVEWTSSSYRPKNGGRYCTGPEVQCQLCNERVSVLVTITLILYNNTARSTLHLYRHACCNSGCLILCTLPLDSAS